MAVGEYRIASVIYTLAERWDGKTWTVEPTPNPAGMNLWDLSGVSCTSATACMAVGTYINASADSVTLAERWNGTTWTVEPTPNPVPTFPGNNGLESVSCTSATACTAVGEFNVPSTNVTVYSTMAERWNGTTWTIQTTPTPTGATSPNLEGVSCTSATACTAVGTSNSEGPTTGASFTVAEKWNGTTWTVEPTPSPNGVKSSILYNVSCTSATACTAVGGGGNGPTSHKQNSRSVAEKWNGTTWTVEPTPSPNGVKSSSLYNVSCTSATACIAVGGFAKATKANFTLAEHRA